MRNRVSLVFQLLSFFCLMPYISMGLYASDKKFYLADASSQLYRPLAYYLAKARVFCVCVCVCVVLCACVGRGEGCNAGSGQLCPLASA